MQTCFRLDDQTQIFYKKQQELFKIVAYEQRNSWLKKEMLSTQQQQQQQKLQICRRISLVFLPLNHQQSQELFQFVP